MKKHMICTSKNDNRFLQRKTRNELKEIPPDPEPKRIAEGKLKLMRFYKPVCRCSTLGGHYHKWFVGKLVVSTADMLKMADAIKSDFTKKNTRQ